MLKIIELEKFYYKTITIGIDTLPAQTNSVGLKERVYRRFLASLRKAGIRPDDRVWLPVDCRIQSYAAMDILARIEENYDTELNVIEVTPVGECFEEVTASYNAYTANCTVRNYSDYKECARRALSGRGDVLVVMPFSADDIALELLGEAAASMWRGLRLDSEFRVAYPFASTATSEILRLYSSCGCIGYYGLPGTFSLFRRLSGRITPTAASKIYVKLSRRMR